VALLLETFTAAERRWLRGYRAGLVTCRNCTWPWWCLASTIAALRMRVVGFDGGSAAKWLHIPRNGTCDRLLAARDASV
jgi:hypothetical protein